MAVASGNTQGSRSPSPSTVVFAPGHFAYNFAGVTASFVMNGHGGILKVKNATGVQLGPPRMVVIDQQNQHVQGTVAKAGPIVDGASAQFTVTFPGAIDQQTVGLIQIYFGDVAYGLLAPAA